MFGVRKGIAMTAMFRDTKLNWGDLKNTLDENKIARETVDNQESEKIRDERERLERKQLVKPDNSEIEYNIPTITNGTWGSLTKIEFSEQDGSIILSAIIYDSKVASNVASNIDELVSEDVYHFLTNQNVELNDKSISELKKLWKQYGSKKATLKVKEVIKKAPAATTTPYVPQAEISYPTERLLPHTAREDESSLGATPELSNGNISDYEQASVDSDFWEGCGARKFKNETGITPITPITPIYYSDAESLAHELKRYLGSYVVGNENCVPYIKSILNEMYLREYIDLDELKQIKTKFNL